MSIVKSIFKIFSGGAWNEHYFKTSSDQVVHTKTDGQASTVKAQLDALNSALSKIYPIGSIYLSTVNTNPSTYFGGTWVAWGSGRVPVGVDAKQTEFAAVEKTGGSKTHKLTTNEMPAHTHRARQEAYNVGPGSGDTVLTYREGVNGAPTTSTGGGAAHNNLQPYITCYMWKRTA